MLKDKYNQLSPGKQRQLRIKFINLFGNRATFYNKIKGVVRVRPAETLFFNEHFNSK